ncbi:acetate/propionate family kinase [Desulfatibacillum aliphaticivorans]|uniref:acetate/propionate family kinase n=1 Tax=Desulfatibacillum aliphaticivorans TaxID=218208 RepID=UPI00047FCE17|nr:acetate kinase [Desulfatibacillum aliphaticivorans]
MKVLVINTGSSSIKYEFFAMEAEQRLAGGIVEKIGEGISAVTHEKILENGEVLKLEEQGLIPDHEHGLKRVVELLRHPEYGVVKDKSEIQAVGHRIVHGGDKLTETMVIDDKVIEELKETVPLAPLHNPGCILGIEVARAVFTNAVHVAVFDTAFHRTIPPYAFMYALPWDMYKKHKVRKYGFHGTSHAYVAEQAAGYLGKKPEEVNQITIHLGNGGSMAAVQGGKCVDTTMGMTPLAGLVMGTRCGDIDPAVLFYLGKRLGMNLRELDILLNKESGLKGLCGTNDMRELLKKKRTGDFHASLALEMYAYRIKKYIGAYMAVMGGLDAIVFTAGVGENCAEVRSLSCQGLETFGIAMDDEKNRAPGRGARRISTDQSPVKIIVVPTNEELRIAQETRRVVGAASFRRYPSSSKSAEFSADTETA